MDGITVHVPVPDVEHEGDLRYAEGLVLRAGGRVVGSRWDGRDGTTGYVEAVFTDRRGVERLATILDDHGWDHRLPVGGEDARPPRKGSRR